MHKLIVRQGIMKHAAEEDGPSFEQQFGILANAMVTDKFPQLNNMKLAFQLIEKSDDNQDACGATVYLVGRTVIFVPAFFRNNKLKTGDMMFSAQSQSFLPLSDPWLAWLKNKDMDDGGKEVPSSIADNRSNPKGVTIREISDPIMKTASVFLKGLLHVEPSLAAKLSDVSILDTAIHMGKQASETLLDKLLQDSDYLNATLTFYSGNDLDKFAKQASALADPVVKAELILPLDKKAHTLNETELKALYKDGFFIRKTAASKNNPNVIRYKQVNGMFSVLSDIGRVQLLVAGGDLKDCLVLRKGQLSDDGWGSDACRPIGCGNGSKTDPSMTAPGYMECSKDTGFVLVGDDGKIMDLPAGVMILSNSKEKFNREMLNGIGHELTEEGIKQIPWEATILLPSGEACRLHCTLDRSVSGKGWVNEYLSVRVSENPDLQKPIGSGNSIILPQGCRILFCPVEFNDDGTSRPYREVDKLRQEGKDKIKSPAPAFVTMGTLDAYITEFCNKRYDVAKIYSNGQEFVISDKLNMSNPPMSIKEAAFTLVDRYEIDPAIAKVMLKEANNGATYDHPRSTQYFLEKRADEMWEDSNIPMTKMPNKPPRTEFQEMPLSLEDPAQLQQAITTAAQNGIKEVFDVTTLKLLVRQNRFFDEIRDDVPLFMQVLDSLCRKLFQFYWHTDKMEEKYGMVKLKALEESLKCAIDSLSELTVFFKLRTVDGSGTVGDSNGELMTGNML